MKVFTLKKLNIIFFLLFILSAIPSSVSAELLIEQDKSLFDALEEIGTVQLKIVSEFENLRTNRRFTEEQKAVVSFVNEKGAEEKLEVKVSIRGRYRRVFSEDIPPLKLNFKKKELKSKGYSEFDELNLVTYFYKDKDVSKQILLKEYLTYKLYNELTPNSYRVQLINIEYYDSETGDLDEQLGFLIEGTDQLRARTGTKKVITPVDVEKTTFHANQTNMMSIFQYMIGNDDWNLHIPKNTRLLDKNGVIVCVPYDFDFCGLVHAPYTIPKDSKNKKSVKTRTFLGQQDDISDLKAVLNVFLRSKDKFFSIIKKMDGLEYSQEEEMLTYLDSFYSELDKRQKKNIGFKTPLS